MERRRFLSTLIGGVAASAAVRTFPFRVFSFPKEIVSAKLFTGVDFGPDPVGVVIWSSLCGGPFRLVEEISLAEAKERYGYEWRAGNSRTQQAKSDGRIYCSPKGTFTTTGIITSDYF